MLTVNRVVAIEAHPVPTETELVNQNTLATYKKLVNGEPVEGIPGSGKFVEDVGPPQLFILDVRALAHRGLATI